MVMLKDKAVGPPSWEKKKMKYEINSNSNQSKKKNKISEPPIPELTKKKKQRSDPKEI